MPVTIRSAVLDDVPALLAMEREAMRAAHWTEEQYARRVEAGVVLVGEEAGSVGFICAKAVAGDWEIENIVVRAEVRRRGIADALLREFLRRVPNQTGAAVWLEVRESNQPARRLYEKHGFREMGRRRAYYREPEEDAVQYELRLESGRNTRLSASLAMP
jgi:ribosomal-protein-alanine N-acetyltransferase